MAPPSKSTVTAVHFSLIFFVMVSLIASVAAYMMYTSYDEAETKRVETERELGQMRTAALNYQEAIEALKQLVGRQFDEVGHNDRGNQNTVYGAAMADINTYGGPLAQQTLVATLQKLREELNTVTGERNQLQTELSEHRQRIAELEGVYQERSDQFSQQASRAEADLQGQITRSEEAIAAKDQEINRLRQAEARLAASLREADDRFTTYEQETEKRLTALQNINETLRTLQRDLMKVSFDRPDGEIRWIDHRTNLVWINLGEADRLTPRTTFSVYSKGHNGVGRGAEDIKGAIEVVRVVGPHMAEARIQGNSLTEPIAVGDPIYTPLWNAGRTERFSFVGLIDLTGDGKSDRELLHEIVSNAGAQIDNEIDDKGNWHGDGITVDTKFLVVGRIPDPTTVLPNEKGAVEEIGRHLKKIREEAMEQGVREVNLNDFLAYIGYRPSYRTWRPGEESPWTLKHGSKSTTVNQSVGDRYSSGNVSGTVPSREPLGPRNTNGPTNGQFRGGSRNGGN